MIISVFLIKKKITIILLLVLFFISCSVIAVDNKVYDNKPKIYLDDQQQTAHYNIAKTDIVLFPARIYFAALKQDNAALLLAQIDKHLMALKAEPHLIYYVLQKVLLQTQPSKAKIFLNQDEKVTVTPLHFENTPDYSLLVTVIILFIISMLLFILWNLSLKHQVLQRTKALKENESLLKQAQLVGHLGSWRLDHHNGQLQWSDMVFRLFELDPEVFKPSYDNFIHAIHPEDRNFVNQAFTQAIENRTKYNIEYRLLMSDGRIKYVNERCYTEYDEQGHAIFSLGTIQDISERKRLEIRLNKLALAVEQSPESIVITNIAAEIEYVNESFIKNTGYSLDEVIGKNPRILRSGKTPRKTYTDLWAYLTQGMTWRGEFYNKRRDGSEYIEYAIITPLHQSDGQITHYVSVKEDITEKKKMLQELDEYRNNLEQLVKQRTEEMNKALEKADAASRAKSEFLANMSHEIRTPINAVLGIAYLLKQEATTEKQQNLLDSIDKSVHHLLSIINNILDLSKIEAGKLGLEYNSFRFEELFDHIYKIFQFQVEDKGLILTMHKEGIPEFLYGDVTRLKQALINLISNAIKFTAQGTIYCRAKSIQDNGNAILICFEVQDSGIGIDTQKQKDIFNIFEQEDASITRNFGGTGLGLAITERLAKLMGGDIGVKSELGKGSLFWFSAWLQVEEENRQSALIPTDTETEQDNSKVKALLQSDYQGGRILLVEDNEINREMMKHLLTAIGLYVNTAETGNDAVKKVKQFEFDLILMDMRMPEMDGIEATRLIRQMEKGKNIPIIAISANTFNEDKQVCFDVGMNDFISKPVDPPDLFRVLLKYLVKPQHSEQRAFINTLDRQQKQEENPPAWQHQLAQIDGLDYQTGLSHFMGNAHEYIAWLIKFDQQHTKEGEYIQDAIAQGHLSLALEKAHSIKGVAGNLGLSAIYAAAKALEFNLRHAVSDNNVVIQTLKQTLYDFHQGIKTLTTPSQEDKPFLNTPDVLLQQLYQLLENDNAEANLFFEQHYRQLEQHYGAPIHHLKKNIDAYYYPIALTIIQSLINIEH